MAEAKNDSNLCQHPGCTKKKWLANDFCQPHHIERPDYSYGLDTDIKRRLAKKRDPNRENAAMKWICEVTGMNLSDKFHESLKSGVPLCRLINVLSPGAIAKVNTSKTAFAQRENIANYLEACREFGIRDTDQFVTLDLFEGERLYNVVDQIYNVCEVAKKQGYEGPVIESKYAALGGGGFSANRVAAESLDDGDEPAAPTEINGKPQVVCSKCGTRQNGGNFCAECGHPL